MGIGCVYMRARVTEEALQQITGLSRGPCLSLCCYLENTRAGLDTAVPGRSASDTQASDKTTRGLQLFCNERPLSLESSPRCRREEAGPQATGATRRREDLPPSTFVGLHLHFDVHTELTNTSSSAHKASALGNGEEEARRRRCREAGPLTFSSQEQTISGEMHLPKSDPGHPSPIVPSPGIMWHLPHGAADQLQ
ncbi:hypothetical protein EYF80_004974 [Liparis tanakae]|uniref:Uncharacterized protein n=1 Tax=Liparis tanakae TaxID=230148 RepID=A0A4Z2J3X9_9TELE|nr:hypothetical protein EYF80_004974 [Liparis tanakae]